MGALVPTGRSALQGSHSFARLAGLFALLAVLGAASFCSAPSALADSQAIVNAAASQAGRPYCWDGGDENGPTHAAGDLGNGGCGGSTIGFDCTGLAIFAVYQGTGISGLPHDGEGNKWAAKGTAIMNQADLQPGDIVFFGGTFGNFDHAGIYVGNGMVWDAEDYNVPVQKHSLAWIENSLPFVGAVRFTGSPPGGGSPPPPPPADNRMVAITGSSALVMQQFGVTGWVTQLQSGDAKKMALAGDRSAAITGCGGLVSQQFGVTGWVTQLQCGDAQAVALSGDRMAAITGCGGLVSQQFGVTGWVTQLQCGDAQAVGLDGSTGYVKVQPFAPPTPAMNTTPAANTTPGSATTTRTTACHTAMSTEAADLNSYLAARQKLRRAKSRERRVQLSRQAAQKSAIWRAAVKWRKLAC
ncbi:MAG TPA: NlpC/P60 family protein [Solirubrobacterales bacterium]|jgi:cell wall-associated NlpC family hydrolase|nr:NlpC/P60 family protein [Solirubrobacterales bacterium]